MTAPTEPAGDVAGARERVSRWANYEYTYEDTVAVSSPLVTFTAGDLRLILSDYDRLRACVEADGEALRKVAEAWRYFTYRTEDGGWEHRPDPHGDWVSSNITSLARARLAARKEAEHG